MIPRMKILWGALLAGILLGQQGLAQQSTPAKDAPVYLPLPKDIQCELQGMSFMVSADENGQMANFNGSVKGVTCWIVGNKPAQKKEIPLASTEMTNGMLRTKDFGNLKIGPPEKLYVASVSIAIRRDKLELLRASLQNQGARNGTDHRDPNTAQKVEANTDAAAIEEKYEPETSDELRVRFETAINKLEFEGRGVDKPGFDVTNVDGTVKKFSIGATDIELVTDKIGMEQGFLTVETKTYGKIRFEAAPSRIVRMWLKPSQKKALLGLLK